MVIQKEVHGELDIRAENVLREYMPLGPQPLPRPTEQCAWVVELPMRHSFEGWPGIEMLQFRHDRNVGEYFFDLFAGGEVLFPVDPLANVAEEILACGELPVDLLDAAIESFASDPLGLRLNQVQSVRKEVSKIVTLTNGRRLLMPEQVALLASILIGVAECLLMCGPTGLLFVVYRFLMKEIQFSINSFIWLTMSVSI